MFLLINRHRHRVSYVFGPAIIYYTDLLYYTLYYYCSAAGTFNVIIYINIYYYTLTVFVLPSKYVSRRSRIAVKFCVYNTNKRFRVRRSLTATGHPRTTTSSGRQIDLDEESIRKSSKRRSRRGKRTQRTRARQQYDTRPKGNLAKSRRLVYPCRHGVWPTTTTPPLRT